MIMVDQLRYPEKGYGSAGIADPIKDILSFVNALDKNPYAKHFPGFLKLREYAVVFTNHTIAESACIPSRASIMTGQYGPRTGVTQTDGLFKSGEARNFPWLRADGAPTIGDYFRELGYTTHYFGKWHLSDPPEHTLEGFGFGDWELSWPEPHGASKNNLGTYRDYQFADLACNFLLARGLGVPYNRASAQISIDEPESSAAPNIAPFFAVCSFTNPHDIAAYPALPRGLPAVYDQDTDTWKSNPGFGPGLSVPIPAEGTKSGAPAGGSFHVPLNPTGFPQSCATAAPTQNEDLLANNKPRAQYDYSFKVGLGLAAKTGLSIAQKQGGDPDILIQRAAEATLGVAIPLQLQEDPNGAAVGFLQYYAYMISMVDRHILRVLEALEQSGLRESTIVVFASDHGEYGAAHSMLIEKWHAAYQETVHVPVLVSSKALNTAKDAPVAVTSQTSHIDVLPTLLGLANATQDDINSARRNLSKTHLGAPLPGANLQGVIKAGGGPVVGPDGKERTAILFVTDDMITEPLPKDDDPHNEHSWQQYQVYEATVNLLRTPPSADAKIKHAYLPDLAPGPVTQPAHVRALRSGDWKLVRYCDPWSERPVADQWELYNLALDPIEATNLLVYNAGFPTVIPAGSLPKGLKHEQVILTAQRLRAELAKQEATLLSPYPSKYPTAGA